MMPRVPEPYSYSGLSAETMDRRRREFRHRVAYAVAIAIAAFMLGYLL